MLACGFYPDTNSQIVFEQGAAALMPDVSYHYLNGKVPGDRNKAYSGIDIFIFPIDNKHELFGLVPIQAMAAGLPVIASDWDSLRDTVGPGVGIRIPTMTTGITSTANQALPYYLGQINFAQYSSNFSAQVEINLPALIEAIVGLASNETLCKKMGENAIKRVKTNYD